MNNEADTQPSAWAEVSLANIAYNVQVLKSTLKPGTQLMAVVKANAYGHGTVPVARAALDAGATWLAVARVSEGVELRAAGLDAPVLLLGPIAPAEATAAVNAQLVVSITSLRFAQALADAAQAAGTTASVHLKIDTGMSRFGVPLDDAIGAAQALTRMDGLRLDGVFMHFATADEADPSFAQLQIARFEGALNDIRRAGIAVPLVHAANSAGILAATSYHFDLVRAGIALYGICPNSAFTQCADLRTALSLKSRVAYVRAIHRGTSVGYGRTFVAPRDMHVALVSIGYADGVRRALSNKGEVLVRGHRARILGRVSMDQIVVDADACEAQEGDEVVLIGRQGDAELSAEEVAGWAGTVSYEILTGIGARVPRVYLSANNANSR
ncbi:MAG: alanine racemase [Chloroflexi bacterium]|nr:alanine racemase [Chloroflexota bacterium]